MFIDLVMNFVIYFSGALNGQQLTNFFIWGNSDGISGLTNMQIVILKVIGMILVILFWIALIEQLYAAISLSQKMHSGKRVVESGLFVLFVVLDIALIVNVAKLIMGVPMIESRMHQVTALTNTQSFHLTVLILGGVGGILLLYAIIYFMISLWTVRKHLNIR